MEQPSAAVCAFINAFIESIDQLRVLLVLARQPDRKWSIGEVCSATALPVTTTMAQLQRLSVIGLITATPEPAATFNYDPRAAEFDQMVRELIQLDDQRPVTLIRLVYSRKSGSAQAFADAFRLRSP